MYMKMLDCYVYGSQTNIIFSLGFDSHHVYLLSDAKKKVLEGSTELHNALSYSSNIWIPIALDVCTLLLFLHFN
jgi:hypothetical protein